MFNCRKLVLSTWANSSVGVVRVLLLGLTVFAVGRLETLITDLNLPNERELLITVSGVKQVKQESRQQAIDRAADSIRLDCLCFEWRFRDRPSKSAGDSQRAEQTSQNPMKMR